MMRKLLPLAFVAALAAVGLAAQQPAPPPAPQQPSELSTVITGAGAGTPPRFAVPDFIALSSDAETVDAASTVELYRLERSRRDVVATPAGSDFLKMADELVSRAHDPAVKEIVLALNATVDGQTTAHYITDLLHGADVTVTRLAHGVPVGGELDYLDEGTLTAAIRSRTPI